MRRGLGVQGQMRVLTGACVLSTAIVLTFSGWEIATLATLAGDADFERAARLATFHVVLLLGAIMGVGVLAGMHVIRGVVECAAAVARRVDVIGQGSFHERVPLEGPREVQEVARAVNAMAESLAWRERRLVHTERLTSVGTLVAGVAHEINNPLTWLHGNEELAVADVEARLAESGLPANERARLTEELSSHEANLEAIRRLASIAEALKDVSRAPRAERTAHDVNRVVRGCLLVAHHRLVQGPALVEDLSATRFVVCDPTEVSQVILNLLLNAADATDKDGTVTVRTRDDADAVVVEIADTGKGIPEHFRARLFEPFATTKPHGTGLGLAIAKRIVDAHGGAISCESEGGKGTTFLVRLPAAAAADAA